MDKKQWNLLNLKNPTSWLSQYLESKICLNTFCFTIFSWSENQTQALSASLEQAPKITSVDLVVKLKII